MNKEEIIKKLNGKSYFNNDIVIDLETSKNPDVLNVVVSDKILYDNYEVSRILYNKITKELNFNYYNINTNSYFSGKDIAKVKISSAEETEETEETEVKKTIITAEAVEKVKVEKKVVTADDVVFENVDLVAATEATEATEATKTTKKSKKSKKAEE